VNSQASAPVRSSETDVAVRCLVGGQCCFLAAMLICCAVRPSWAAVRYGLSYYGNDFATVVPYTSGFAFCIALSAVGLVRLPTTAVTVHQLRRAVVLALGLMALIPLTPYRVDLFFDRLHTGAAAALFAIGYTLGIWIALRLIRDRRASMLLAVQTLAVIGICATIVGWTDYMIPCELGFQLALGGLLVRAVRRLPIAAQPRVGMLRRQARRPQARGADPTNVVFDHWRSGRVPTMK
jgi:hypothetical protein